MTITLEQPPRYEHRSGPPDYTITITTAMDAAQQAAADLLPLVERGEISLPGGLIPRSAGYSPVEAAEALRLVFERSPVVVEGRARPVVVEHDEDTDQAESWAAAYGDAGETYWRHALRVALAHWPDRYVAAASALAEAGTWGYLGEDGIAHHLRLWTMATHTPAPQIETYTAAEYRAQARTAWAAAHAA